MTFLTPDDTDMLVQIEIFLLNDPTESQVSYNFNTPFVRSLVKTMYSSNSDELVGFELQELL